MRRADQSSLVGRCVRSRNIVKEEAQVQWGLLCQNKEKDMAGSEIVW